VNAITESYWIDGSQSFLIYSVRGNQGVGRSQLLRKKLQIFYLCRAPSTDPPLVILVMLGNKLK
jgi:hypothetical protein